MKTEFKIFRSGCDSLGEAIKEYQKEHHLEIKNVVSIENRDAKNIIGVIFERSSEYEEPQNLKPNVGGC